MYFAQFKIDILKTLKFHCQPTPPLDSKQRCGSSILLLHIMAHPSLTRSLVLRLLFCSYFLQSEQCAKGRRTITDTHKRGGVHRVGCFLSDSQSHTSTNHPREKSIKFSSNFIRILQIFAAAPLRESPLVLYRCGGQFTCMCSKPFNCPISDGIVFRRESIKNLI